MADRASTTEQRTRLAQLDVPYIQLRFCAVSMLPSRARRNTINTRRKATVAYPDHQTPFVPHVLPYEPSKPLQMPENTLIKRALKHRVCGFPNLC